MCLIRLLWSRHKQNGAVEACWAHNPEVRGSKPRSANPFFMLLSVECTNKEFIIYFVEAAVHSSSGCPCQKMGCYRARGIYGPIVIQSGSMIFLLAYLDFAVLRELFTLLNLHFYIRFRIFFQDFNTGQNWTHNRKGEGDFSLFFSFPDLLTSTYRLFLIIYLMVVLVETSWRIFSTIPGAKHWETVNLSKNNLSVSPRVRRLNTAFFSSDIFHKILYCSAPQTISQILVKFDFFCWKRLLKCRFIMFRSYMGLLQLNPPASPKKLGD